MLKCKGISLDYNQFFRLLLGEKMKNDRLKNTLAIIINTLIIVFTFDANYYNFRTDVIRNELVYGFSGMGSFCFFTVLSNDFLLIAALIALVFEVKNSLADTFVLPKWVFNLKFSATTAVTVTFVTVVVFLAPYAEMTGTGYFTLFLGNNFSLHFLSPLLGIFAFIFLERADEFKFKTTVLGVVPTALYSVVYITMVAIIGEKNGGWPDFYGFTFGGKMYLAPISALAMLAASYLFAYLLRKFNQRVNRK